MRNHLRKITVTFACALATAGCAFGRHHAYHLANPHMAHRGSLSVALAVLDQREPVVSGAKGPDFVGLSRGGFGNTFDIGTASRQPLADDFATSIGRGLEGAGHRVIPVRLSGGMSAAQVQDALLGARAER